MLPSFIRRELELEEVALYERADMTGLTRVAGTAPPGDPARAAFLPLLVAPLRR